MELFVVPCLMPTARFHYVYKFDIFILPDQLHAAHIACCHYSYTCYNCLKLISPPLTPTACCHYLYKFDNYIWPASVLFCALCLLSLSRCDTCCRKSPPLHGQLPAVTTWTNSGNLHCWPSQGQLHAVMIVACQSALWSQPILPYY